MPEQIVEIRGDGAIVRLNFSHRAYPEAQDYWDGNWVVAHIQAETQGFKADFADQVHLGDVVRFYEEVLTMYTTLLGEATLAMLEEFLIVTGRMNTRGGLNWSAMIAQPFRRSNRLQFEFKSDQSYLPTLIQQLESLLVEFGVRGRP